MGIDIAEGMIDAARLLARERHLDRRTEYRIGDLLALRETIPLSDITIADKVVCCYDDLPAFLSSSLSSTRRIYALSYPRPHLLNLVLIKLMAALSTLLGMSFRPYWHDWRSMRSSIEYEGFRRIWSASTIFWEVDIFGRDEVVEP